MTPDPLVPGPRLTEVADRVWVAALDGRNATVVAGADGLLLVDAPGAGLVEEVRRIGRGDVVTVALTDGHPDRRTGLEAVREAWPACTVHAHEDAGVADADRPFSSVGVVELGDRVVELVHPGRGHCAGDLVARVADADVLVVGDLAGPDGAPYGEDGFPLEWPAALDVGVGLLTGGSVVVPGRGRLLDQPALQDQRADVGTVAESLFDLAARSVPEDEAVETLREAVGWPVDLLRHAVRRARSQVPRTARRLPLV
jgi:glyoxylase-like metal-dependent hydrolase (beta-lactamase superfamily II)